MLSDTQIEQLKTELDTLPAGEGAIGAIVGAALIVFFVLLFKIHQKLQIAIMKFVGLRITNNRLR